MGGMERGGRDREIEGGAGGREGNIEGRGRGRREREKKGERGDSVGI